MGWLKWREFGRRGRSTRDQVIQVQTWNSNVRGLWAPSWSQAPKQVPSTPTPLFPEEWGKVKREERHASDL